VIFVLFSFGALTTGGLGGLLVAWGMWIMGLLITCCVAHRLFGRRCPYSEESSGSASGSNEVQAYDMAKV
jgi:hypothetical protein